MEQFRNIIYTTLPTKHNIQIIECIIVDGKLNGDIKNKEPIAECTVAKSNSLI